MHVKCFQNWLHSNFQQSKIFLLIRIFLLFIRKWKFSALSTWIDVIKNKLKKNVISFSHRREIEKKRKRKKLFSVFLSYFLSSHLQECHLNDEARSSPTYIFMIGRQHVPHWCDNLWDFAEWGIRILSFNRCLSVSEK